MGKIARLVLVYEKGLTHEDDEAVLKQRIEERDDQYLWEFFGVGWDSPKEWYSIFGTPFPER